jgi:hypothetical protein
MVAKRSISMTQAELNIKGFEKKKLGASSVLI